MQFSLRTFLLLVTMTCAGAAAVAWYRSLPPAVFDDWHSCTYTPNADNGKTDGRIHIGCFSRDDTPFAGFLIRSNSVQNQVNAPWLDCENGLVTIMGKSITPQTKFQLFVSENESDPAVISLDDSEVREFIRHRHALFELEAYFEQMYDRSGQDAG